MTKTLTLSMDSWHKLQEKIIEDHGRTTLLISWRLKANLGFSVREHTWHGDSDSNGFMDRFTDIRLDFYDEQLQTLFLLKYSEFLTKF